MQRHAHRKMGAAREYAVLGVALLAAALLFAFTWSGSPLSGSRVQDSPPLQTTPALPPAAPEPRPERPVDPVAARPGTTGKETEVSLRFGRREPVAKAPGTIRVMSYNVENLFDDKDDPALSGKNDDKNMTKPAAHCQAAADAIRRCSPDVIALQEVESYEALMQFRDQYLKDMGYDHVVSIDTGDPRGIENSVLSRFPLEDVKTWRELPLGGTHPDLFGTDKNDYAGQPITFKRSPLRVTVTIPAAKVAELMPTESSEPTARQPYKLTLFVVHQKSGRGGDYWRERESAKTIELAQEVMNADKGVNVIILGDFNARSRDQSLKAYVAAGFKELFDGQNADRDLTATTHASGRRIDHILYNSNAAHELLIDSRFVLAMPTRADGVDYRTTPPPKGYASDHFPVVVDLRPVD